MEGGNSISTSSGEDRISNLPDSLIHHILSFLSDTTYAVQTCVLSKRWRYIWTSLPVLKFSDEFHYDDSDVEEDYFIDRENMCFINRFIRFVDKVLSLRDNNSDIQMFHFEYSPPYHWSGEKSERFVNRCIAAAASHNVQELCIKIKPNSDAEFLRLVSSCKSLTKLDLELCGYDDGEYSNCSIICIPSEISFPRLESLCMNLEFFPFEDEELTNNFFSSFPNLESGFRDMNLTISLPKLKYFSFKVEDQGYEINSVIKLHDPSLSSFIFESDMVTSFIVENLPSLVTADIKICAATSGEDKEFYAQRMMGLLGGFNWELQTCLLRDCLRWVFYILKIIFVECMICHLKFAEVNDLCGCADELKFLEILLKLPVLEKVVLASNSTEQDSQQKKRMAKFSEMLLKFPTASKKILILLKF
ncbi:hypothetical protein MKW92_041324 [Papaver armeniacum]|nr:hypothetical protein MKW92_041324 [Papaver armeniacum]